MNSDNLNYIIRDLVEMSPQELLELAILHQTCLPYTIGSKLGLHNLVAYYLTLVENVESVNKVAIQDNKVIGLICSTTRKSVKTKSESDFASKILKEVIKPRFLLNNLSSLFDLFQIRILRSDCAKDGGYISVFFVSSSVQKHGVGSELLRECIELHRERNMKNLYVDTRKYSESALAIYRKFGFVETKRTLKSVLLKKSL